MGLLTVWNDRAGVVAHALAAFSVVGGVAALAMAPPSQMQLGAMACLVLAGCCYAGLAVQSARHARRLVQAHRQVQQLVAGALEAPPQDPRGADRTEPLLQDLAALQQRMAAVVRDVHAGTLAIATSSGHVGSDHTRFAAMMSTLASSIDDVNGSM